MSIQFYFFFFCCECIIQAPHHLLLPDAVLFVGWLGLMPLSLYVLFGIHATSKKRWRLPILVTKHWAGSWSRCTGSQPVGDYKSSTRRSAAITVARPVVTFPAAEQHRPLAGTKLYCLVTKVHRCEQFARGWYVAFASSKIWTHDLLIASPTLYPLHYRYKYLPEFCRFLLFHGARDDAAGARVVCWRIRTWHVGCCSCGQRSRFWLCNVTIKQKSYVVNNLYFRLAIWLRQKPEHKFLRKWSIFIRERLKAITI